MALDARGLIHDLIREAHIDPRPHLLGHENPARGSLLWAAWHVLRIPTNVVLVSASALGYYFFAGMQVFGVEFVHGWFGLAHSAALGWCFCLGAVNPPMDVARLDIMHPYLWGRAESVRVALRQIGEALGPVLFGYVAEHVFGGGAVGLRWTFLVMLVPLFVSGGIAFLVCRTYPRDVATAGAYAQRTWEREKSDEP